MLNNFDTIDESINVILLEIHRAEGKSMTYKIALCDDNQQYLEILSDKLENYGEKKGIDFIIHKFSDSTLLMEWTEEKKLFDAYFLDIEMPCYTGIELAKKIREYSSVSLIVFVTAYESFAVEACGLNVIQYLLKKQILSRIEELMDELVFRLSCIQDDKVYIIMNQRRYIKLKQKDIIYIYKYQKNVYFVMADKREEKERISLQDVFNKLDNKDMLWLDRGIILNLHHVWSISGTNIKMTGGYEITTNEAHVTELKKALEVYWEKLL